LLTKKIRWSLRFSRHTLLFKTANLCHLSTNTALDSILLYFKQTDRRKPANAFLGQEPIHIQPRTIRAMLELEPQNLSVDDYMPNQFGEYFLYEVNHNTFAKIGADAIFKRTYGKNLDAKESLYLLLGSDSGYATK
jgi:hypothetical protein